MLSVKSAINKSYNKDRPANILTVFYDGVFDCALAETGHNFYGDKENVSYKWDTLFKIKPSNLITLSKAELYHHHYDLILINNRLKFKDLAKKYAEYFSIPVVIVDHEVSPDNRYISKHMVPNYAETIGTTYFIKDSFQARNLFEPGFDVVNKEKDIDFVIAGDFLEEDRAMIDNMMGVSKNSRFIGNLNVKNSMMPSSYEEYVDIIHRSKIFVHLNTKPGISYDAIRALFSHCLLLTTHNPLLEKFLSEKFINGYRFQYSVHEAKEMSSQIGTILEDYQKPKIKMWESTQPKWKTFLEKTSNKALIL